jgi:RNA polymerase sigma factor (sigma-70 family)
MRLGSFMRPTSGWLDRKLRRNGKARITFTRLPRRRCATFWSIAPVGRRPRSTGGRVRCELHDSATAAPEESDEVLAVHDALDRLAAADPRAAELVKLRYFAGMPIADVARALHISPRTADRLWAYARAWLRHAIAES